MRAPLESALIASLAGKNTLSLSRQEEPATLERSLGHLYEGAIGRVYRF